MHQSKTTITLNLSDISRSDAANTLLALSATTLQNTNTSKKSVTFDLSQNIVHEITDSINQEPVRQAGSNKRKCPIDAPLNKKIRVTPSEEPYITQSGRISTSPFKGKSRYR